MTWAPLFRRAPRGVTLTAAGARAAPGLTQGFDALMQAAATLRHEARPASCGCRPIRRWRNCG